MLQQTKTSKSLSVTPAIMETKPEGDYDTKKEVTPKPKEQGQLTFTKVKGGVLKQMQSHRHDLE